MKELRKLIAQYGHRYSTATIYIAFAIVSLLVSVILFGILRSTGVMKLAFTGAVEQAEFGGAFAGFIATLVFLIRSYNGAMKHAGLTITGNVLLPDGSPVQGAVVFVEGFGRTDTDSVGKFEIEVNEQESWVVHASHEDRNAQETVARGDIGKPIRLTLPKIAQPLGVDPEYDRRFKEAQERDNRSRQRLSELIPAEAIVAEQDVERTHLNVLLGSILNASVDILVSSDDNHLQAKGGVAKAILNKAGLRVGEELEHHSQYPRILRQGDIAVTTGGGTGARAIFHPAVIEFEENRYPDKDVISKIVRRSLICAVALGAESIAFPVLGGGTAKDEKRFRPWDSIQAILAEAVNHALGSDVRVDGPLRHIALYVFNPDDIQGDIRALVNALVEASRQNPDC